MIEISPATIEKYFDKFNADLIADKMIQGSNWPREGYKTQSGEPFTKSQILEKWDEIGE